MEYNMKEILSKEELKNIIKETVNEVADTVCYTYGPNGKTVILSDFEGNGIITKDGVSVSNAINYDNPYKNIITNIMKEVAQKTVDEADDGTTTSICLTQAFINRGFELMEQGVSYNDIKDALEYLSLYVVKEINKASKKTKKKDIINIALTASNNDVKIAKIINDAYKHSPIVKVEESTLSYDTITKINGMTLRTTYFDQAFINDISTQSIKYSECYIALIQDTMYTVDPIAALVNKIEGKPLIIIADHFSDNVLRIIKQHYNSGSLKVALVAAPGVNNHRANIVDDISTYTSATVLDNSKKYTSIEYLGKADGVEIKKDEMIIFNETTNKAVHKRLHELKELINTDLPKYNKELTQQRINSLSGSASVIKVGGDSPVEVKEKFDRYEDAIGSVKHALDEGYVKGGGLTLKYIADNAEFTKTPILELTQCLYSCNNKMPEIIDDTVIDPAKVTRCAIENSISVAKTLLSTEAIVLNKHLWKRD